MSETKIYSKKDFGSFMSTLDVIKNFNDSVTFTDGKAFFRSADKSMLIKAICDCRMDIELTKLTSKIPIFQAYIGDTVEIGTDDRNYVINNGSDIIRFPIAEDPSKMTEEEYTTKYNDNLVGDPILVWEIDENKFGAIRKYFEGFGTLAMKFQKASNSNEFNIRIGDEGITGSAEIYKFEIPDNSPLVGKEIRTNCQFEFISAAGKCFNGLTIKIYYHPENEWLIFVSDMGTEFVTMQFFRAKPAVSAAGY